MHCKISVIIRTKQLDIHKSVKMLFTFTVSLGALYWRFVAIFLKIWSTSERFWNTWRFLITLKITKKFWDIFTNIYIFLYFLEVEQQKTNRNEFFKSTRRRPESSLWYPLQLSDMTDWWDSLALFCEWESDSVCVFVGVSDSESVKKFGVEKIDRFLEVLNYLIYKYMYIFL